MGFDIVMLIERAIVQGVPLIFGATGEIITEKSGNLNLGIPGIMYVGGISGTIGAFFYQRSVETLNPFLGIMIPLLCTLIGSTLVALIYSFLTITLKANQNVTGLALTTFGVGLGNFFGGSLTKLIGENGNIPLTQTSQLYKTSFPFADKLGVFGDLFFADSYGFMTYLAVVIAVIAAIILKRTRVGLNLRAVGENPATADAAGINVTRYKYVATCTGGAIAGLGGLFYVIGYTGSWSNDGFGDRGWLAIALVIFALWKPMLGLLGSLLFGALYMITIQAAYVFSGATLELIKMLPYVATILVLVFVSIRKKREHQPPESLGLSYFREDR